MRQSELSISLEKEGGTALRLGVRKTGCSGWAYEVSIAKEIDQQVLFI